MKNEFSSGMASLPGNYEEEEKRHARWQDVTAAEYG